MSDDLTGLPVAAFLERLAGPTATPGGGSAAALAGAVGASLVAMVAGLSASKTDGNDAAAFTEMAARARQLAQSLSQAVDRDAAAYDAVMTAYALPRAMEDDKRTRRAAIQNALKGAAEVPWQAAQECRRAAGLAAQALETGNPNAASDAMAAGLLALAGLECAALNVAVNLDGIKDAAYNIEKRNGLRALLSDTSALRAQLWALARARFASLPTD